MKTIQDHLYNYPVYYELVFGSDWRAEYDFIRDCTAQYLRGPLRRMFEPACGTGRLLFRFAKSGIAISGLDLNEKAIEYCNARLKKYGLPQTAFVGDMCDFELPEPVDVAFNPINSFRHLTRERQAEDHLACMEKALAPGGLYLLALHLTPTEGQAMEEEAWSARRGSLQVDSYLWSKHIDHDKREELLGMRFDVRTPSQEFRLEEEVIFRTYTAAQMKQLLDQFPAFELLEIYDFRYDLAEPIRITPSTEDVVLILQKRSE